MTIEIVDFPIKNGGSFHSYVSLPEGITTIFLWFSYDFPIKPPRGRWWMMMVEFADPLFWKTRAPKPTRKGKAGTFGHRLFVAFQVQLNEEWWGKNMIHL